MKNWNRSQTKFIIILLFLFILQLGYELSRVQKIFYAAVLAYAFYHGFKWFQESINSNSGQ